MSTSQLNRSLGLRSVLVVVIGNIIGSGVYKKVAPMAAELHSSGWVLICWVLGGIITLFGALSNAEVAACSPTQGENTNTIRKSTTGFLLLYLAGRFLSSYRPQLFLHWPTCFLNHSIALFPFRLCFLHGQVSISAASSTLLQTLM